MRPVFAAVLGIPLVIACTGEKKDSDSAPIPGTSGNCGDNAPEIQNLWVEDGGMHEFEQDEFYPSIMIRAEITDFDDDLTFWTMRVWFDSTVDGRVLAEGEYAEVRGTLGDEDCSVPSATVGMRMAITTSEKNPDFSTETEFGVVVFDEEDHPSAEGEPEEAVFFTPDEEGNYPDSGG